MERAIREPRGIALLPFRANRVIDVKPPPAPICVLHVKIGTGVGAHADHGSICSIAKLRSRRKIAQNVLRLVFAEHPGHSCLPPSLVLSRMAALANCRTGVTGANDFPAIRTDRLLTLG